MARPSHSFPAETKIPEGGKRGQAHEGLSALISKFLAHPSFKDCIAHVEVKEAREAVYGNWPAQMADNLVSALIERGVQKPYSHQELSIRKALNGENTVLVTPTASGKSLCYNVPVIQSILDDPESRALYLFPTKALSHDQYDEVYALTKACGSQIKVYTYDGDTPPATRRALRDSGHIVVTNPDMMHNGILPHHTRWIKLFENLKYIVIDELHQYRGVFGSHLANVLRRLNRICRFYGTSPVFLCSSATIANPGELARELTGKDFHVIDESGAPTGKKTFIFFNPPVVNRELSVRRSARLEARRVSMRFLAQDHQVIVFGRSRVDIEVMTTYLKRGMKRIHRDSEKIAGYRGGYLPTERRAIERGLKKKEILGVVSTNALELGIDIGSLDVSIIAGWPGTIASAWQQAGRAGRKSTDSLTIYIGGSSPLDQFYMNHPGFFFGRSPEEGLINPENLPIMASHLKCASFELPFEDGEKFGATDPSPILQHLENEGLLRHSGERWYYSADSYPAEDVSLRSAVGENFIVLDTGRNNLVIAEVDYDSAPFLIHDDAIYIHNGKTYIVEKLDWDRRTAFVRHKIVDYYTDAESSSTVQVLQVDQETELRDHNFLIGKRFGDVSVTTVIKKFKKVKFETQESIGYGLVEVPQLETQTESAWLSFQPTLMRDLKVIGYNAASILQSIASLFRHTIPIYVMCDPRDFSVYAMLKSPFDQTPSIYIWDRYPGGIGIARRFYAIEQKILRACLDMVAQCSCEHGCPACIGPKSEKEGHSKRGVIQVLRSMLDEKDHAGESSS